MGIASNATVSVQPRPSAAAPCGSNVARPRTGRGARSSASIRAGAQRAVNLAHVAAERLRRPRSSGEVRSPEVTCPAKSGPRPRCDPIYLPGKSGCAFRCSTGALRNDKDAINPFAHRLPMQRPGCCHRPDQSDGVLRTTARSRMPLTKPRRFVADRLVLLPAAGRTKET